MAARKSSLFSERALRVANCGSVMRSDLLSTSTTSLRDRIKTGKRGKRSGAPVGGDRAIDQPWIERRNSFIVEAKFLHDPAGKVLDDHVGLANQIQRNLTSFRHGKVERDAALVAIQAEISSTLSTDFGVFIRTRVVATVWILDLDDVRAEISKRLRTGRTG